MESSQMTVPRAAGGAVRSSSRSWDWLAPLTGVGFVVTGIASFLIGGNPKSASHPANEIVEYWVDNKDAVELAAFVGIAAATLLVFFGAYLRKVLRAAAGESEMLSI